MVSEILVYHNSAASGLVHGALAEKKNIYYNADPVNRNAPVPRIQH